MKYNCPICGAALAQMAGESVHPGDVKYGVTLWCSADACPCPEVSGHGITSERAFEIIQQKFKKRE